MLEKARLALFGASPDTPNLGVSALFQSTLTGLSQYIDQLEIVVFDNGLGRREENVELITSRQIRLIRYGARGGMRYYRPENLTNMLLASKAGNVGKLFNEGVRLIDSCDAVLDISGGDSFSDIYGINRFNVTYRFKAIALSRKKPLILLPQTYGPYSRQRVRKRASTIVKQASLVWARDPESFTVLRDLMGDSFNPGIHLSGVDMAFGLASSPDITFLETELVSWLNDCNQHVPIVGINVSGLIYNNPKGALKVYRMKSDYRDIVQRTVRELLEKTSCNIVLIPHVNDAIGHYESDLAANQDIIKQFHGNDRTRIKLVPPTLTASQVKTLISRLDWFCGTRMHSTIAALSSGVPTATIAYSDKALGVFGTCGQSEYVFDPRNRELEEIVGGLLNAYKVRDTTRLKLQKNLIDVVELCNLQMLRLIDFLCALQKKLAT